MAKMNLNICTAQLLSNLPSINLTLANAIIDCRDRRPNQVFTHINDVWKVNGMNSPIFHILDRYVQVRPDKTVSSGEIPPQNSRYYSKPSPSQSRSKDCQKIFISRDPGQIPVSHDKSTQKYHTKQSGCLQRSTESNKINEKSWIEVSAQSHGVIRSSATQDRSQGQCQEHGQGKGPNTDQDQCQGQSKGPERNSNQIQTQIPDLIQGQSQGHSISLSTARSQRQTSASRRTETVSPSCDFPYLPSITPSGKSVTQETAVDSFTVSPSSNTIAVHKRTFETKGDNARFTSKNSAGRRCISARPGKAKEYNNKLKITLNPGQIRKTTYKPAVKEAWQSNVQNTPTLCQGKGSNKNSNPGQELANQAKDLAVSSMSIKIGSRINVGSRFPVLPRSLAPASLSVENVSLHQLSLSGNQSDGMYVERWLEKLQEEDETSHSFRSQRQKTASKNDPPQSTGYQSYPRKECRLLFRSSKSTNYTHIQTKMKTTSDERRHLRVEKRRQNRRRRIRKGRWIRRLTSSVNKKKRLKTVLYQPLDRQAAVKKVNGCGASCLNRLMADRRLSVKQYLLTSLKLASRSYLYFQVN